MAQDLQLRIRISADGRAAIEGTQQVERQVEQLGDTAKKIGGLIAAYLSFEFLSSATEALFTATAALQSFQARFEALGGSAAMGAREMAYVQETARTLSMDLNVARESYGQLLALQQAGLTTQAQARSLLEGYAKAAMMTGAGNEQLKQSMAGLAQAMSMGTVNTENAMQALEPIPGLQKKVADALGMSIATMKKAWEDGEISSQRFGTAVAQALNDMGKGAEGMANTLGPTLQRVKNEWTLLLEALGTNSGFDQAAAAILSSLETMLRDATALIQSGWLADAFAAQIAYIQSFWADLGNTLADAQFFADVQANWESLWQGIRDATGNFVKNFITVLTDLPEVVAGFTVIAAAQIDQWGADLSVVWAVIRAEFAVSWEGMKQFLVGTLNQMVVAVAQGVDHMGRLLGGFLSGAAAQLRRLPEFMSMGGVADTFQAGADQITTASADMVQSAERQRAASEASSQGIIKNEYAKVAAVKATAQATKEASEQAAQQTVLELNARTKARDASLAQAQAQRRAAEASAAQTPITAANSAALTANATESDKATKAAEKATKAAEKAAKAQKDAADKIAEQSQKLEQETAALQSLTQAYLTFNDATVAQVRIENELQTLDPALRDQGRAKAIAELNQQTAQRLYDLDYAAQLQAQEAIALLTSAEALETFNTKKELEAILRERNTGALDAETAQVVEQAGAAD